MFDSFDIPDRAAERSSTAEQSCLVSLGPHNAFRCRTAGVLLDAGSRHHRAQCIRIMQPSPGAWGVACMGNSVLHGK